MGAQENKQIAHDAYAAFGRGDAEGAMRNIDESIVWTVRGENALTGTYSGRQAVGELWGKFLGEGFSTSPREFIADGDKVIVLTTAQFGDESVESVDVLTYNDAGRLIAFDTFGDPSVTNRVFAA